jgi:hypothetical protein
VRYTYWQGEGDVVANTLEMVRRYLALADDDAANAHRTASPADRWRL